MFIIFSFITLGFVGVLTFQGILDIDGVKATNITVAKGGGGDYITIQAAIDNAIDGDTIYVWEGIYFENVIVNKRVSIIGNGTDKTYVNGSRVGDVFFIDTDGVSIAGVNISYSAIHSQPLWAYHYAGIELNYVRNVHIYDVVCTDNFFGIFINNSDYNTIEDNKIIKNKFDGIFFISSENNTIKNNICSLNENGMFLYSQSNTNLIFKNSCDSNRNSGIGAFLSAFNVLKNNSCDLNEDYGIMVSLSSYFTIVNNTCNNNYDGMDFIESHNNLLDNNNCDFNDVYGIYMDSSNNNIVSNNSFNSNLVDGYDLMYSDSNIFSNNTFKSNGDLGMYISWSESNTFSNNSFITNSNDGLSINYYSKQNIFKNNNFSNNGYGLSMFQDCQYNSFIENIISYNTIDGIFIRADSNNNEFYHNLIISNTHQATDRSINHWSKNQEGNYWSDYSGIDNGADGRTAGDGIGDTKLPHPGSGMDRYPFILPYGWLYPGIPVLLQPEAVSYDGYYNITWNKTNRCDGYILEEAESGSFESPTIIYSGPNLQYNFSGKINGTYYYRVKGYNQWFESAWSNIVQILVDWPPAAPTGLVVKEITGHEVMLAWNMNTEPDLDGYHILINDSGSGTSGPFHLIHSVSKDTNQFIVKDLVEETDYNLTIIAFDLFNLNSTFSNIVSTTTNDATAPAAPTKLNATVASDSQIWLSWDANTESDLAGYIVYINDTNNNQFGKFHVRHILGATDTKYTVTGLAEQTTYHFKLKAFDYVPNNSSFSGVASGTTLDLTPPSTPTELNVFNATESSLTISWTPPPESDVMFYRLYWSLSHDGPFTLNDSVVTNKTIFVDSGLDEGTTYYYIVIAIDDVDWKSKESTVAAGKTIFGPHKPEINNSIPDRSLREDEYDDHSINLYYIFKDVNNDPLEFWSKGEDFIKVTIFQENGTVILQPRLNWNGLEEITFFASDGTGGVSDDVLITVTPLNDPPENPQIISFDDNIKLGADDRLDLEARCHDPDLPYGDELTYTWSSSIMGELGKGRVIDNVKLDGGKHIITVEVSDKDGLSSMISLNVTVQQEAGTGLNTAAVSAVVIIIILIMLLIVFFLFKRKREKTVQKTSAEAKPQKTSKTPEQPTQIVPASGFGVVAGQVLDQQQIQIPVQPVQQPSSTVKPIEPITPKQTQVVPITPTPAQPKPTTETDGKEKD
jgi:parallel beta-helix repeat protein